MGSKVDGRCIKCNNDFTYIFGTIPELIPINTFLNYYVKTQKDYFIKENLDDLIRDSLKEDKKYNSESEENKKAVTEKVYKYIIDFFKPEEIEKLKTKILISYEIEMYPFVNIHAVWDERKVLNLPLLKLNFLDGEKYLRVYKPFRYITFTDDHKYLLCPKDLENIVMLNNEERI